MIRVLILAILLSACAHASALESLAVQPVSVPETVCALCELEPGHRCLIGERAFTYTALCVHWVGF